MSDKIDEKGLEAAKVKSLAQELSHVYWNAHRDHLDGTVAEEMAKVALPISKERIALSADDVLDAVDAIRKGYAAAQRDALDQMEMWAAQGDVAEVSRYSMEAERHGAALLAANRILSLLEKALTAASLPERVNGTGGRRQELARHLKRVAKDRLMDDGRPVDDPMMLEAAAALATPLPVRDETAVGASAWLGGENDGICDATAMRQWEASLKRADLTEKDRVRGALEAFKRQAIAIQMLPHPLPAVAEPGVVTDEMVEAAAKAMHDGPLGADDEAEYTSDKSNKAAEWCRELARAGLSAALEAGRSSLSGEAGDK